MLIPTATLSGDQRPEGWTARSRLWPILAESDKFQGVGTESPTSQVPPGLKMKSKRSKATAAELMAELAKDPEFVRQAKEREDKRMRDEAEFRRQELQGTKSIRFGTW
jgi:hypothetical protein